MIEVIISTYNDGIVNAIKVPLTKRHGIKYLICHQVTSEFKNENAEKVDAFLKKRNDVRHLKFNNIGLSKNRNNGLNNIGDDSSFIYLCDDDVKLSESIIESVKCAFSDNNFDLITFEVHDQFGNPFKRYRTEKFRHNKLSVMSVSSIEMIIKRNVLSSSKVKFDERFGIGSEYVASEENIFLIDLLNSNHKIGFIPEVIVFHPMESSGRNWSNNKMAYSKGAFFRRSYGSVAGLFLLLIFSFKKRVEYKEWYSLSEFIKCNLKSYISLVK